VEWAVEQILSHFLFNFSLLSNREKILMLLGLSFPIKLYNFVTKLLQPLFELKVQPTLFPAIYTWSVVVQWLSPRYIILRLRVRFLPPLVAPKTGEKGVKKSLGFS
jgi:hypothetical protein